MFVIEIIGPLQFSSFGSLLHKLIRFHLPFPLDCFDDLLGIIGLVISKYDPVDLQVLCLIVEITLPSVLDFGDDSVTHSFCFTLEHRSPLVIATSSAPCYAQLDVLEFRPLKCKRGCPSRIVDFY